ncbi:hypothetical protein ACFVT8_23475 [Lysinibacillus sp. NPDC058147]|uniref:hypothetical protein n=1 Tax=unclassified Lysinibacillus TaxID=2636778 RepID=UPI0036D768CD
MAEKVKVSREVKEARELLLKTWTLTEVFKSSTADHEVCHEHIKTLSKWHLENNDEGEGLMNLLLGNFILVETPEEKFNYFYDKYSQSDLQFEKDFLNGMLAVAKWFELGVKGVNE